MLTEDAYFFLPGSRLLSLSRRPGLGAVDAAAGVAAEGLGGGVVCAAGEAAEAGAADEAPADFAPGEVAAGEALDFWAFELDELGGLVEFDCFWLRASALGVPGNGVEPLTTCLLYTSRCV